MAQAQEELKATGARLRLARAERSGLGDGIGRRVAELAAAGLTTRQIAQSLFVTTKAFSYHLR